MARDDETSPHFPTYVIVASLLTVVSWELEIVVILLKLSGKLDRHFAPVGHAALIGLSSGLTIFAIVKGHKEYARVGHLGGRIPLTRSQTVAVTGLIVVIGMMIG